jgi:peptidyl-prolyl cis-trans isomerase A (cyclophilin A)
MNKASRGRFFLLLLLSVGIPLTAMAQEVVTVVIATELGKIEVAVDIKRAPITAANFLRYVDSGFYDGGSFHRTVTPQNQPNDAVKIEVVQASVDPARKKRYPAIKLERTSVTGLKHEEGTISMARGAPDSATSSFFICIGAQPELDYQGKRSPDGQGFAAFGRVTSGMDVVRAIHQSPRNAGQRLTPAIKMISIKRKTTASQPPKG